MGGGGGGETAEAAWPGLPDATGTAVEGLEPAALWRHFLALARIPRPSGSSPVEGDEAAVLAYLRSYAAAKGFAARQDAAGNLVICRPGGGGGERKQTVVLQGHVDMVCVKTLDSAHDFSRDPIELRRDGDWIRAKDTTLGSDNGVGVAAALAVMDLPPDTPLPPIECCCTVDEETGLTGAQKFDPAILTGRMLVNLDTEQWTEMNISCAGNGQLNIRLPAGNEHVGDFGTGVPPEKVTRCTIGVSGLLGGHSGVEIHLDRANAIVMLANVLARVSEELGRENVEIESFEGGQLRNSIAKSAAATIHLRDAESAEAASRAVSAYAGLLKKEFGAVETAMEVSWESRETSNAVPVYGGAWKLVDMLRMLPHGVVKRSHVLPIVETSVNLAVVTEGKKDESSTVAHYDVITTTRSAFPHALEAARERQAMIAEVCGASRVDRLPAYSGWAHDPNSELLKLTVGAYTEVLGRAPTLKASHAGLECGVLSGRNGGLQCVSFGPEIRGAHSTDERCQISTVQPFFEVLLKLLTKLATGP